MYYYFWAATCRINYHEDCVPIRKATDRLNFVVEGVNRRRTGFSGTAGSGIGFPLPATGPPGPVAAAVGSGQANQRNRLSLIKVP